MANIDKKANPYYLAYNFLSTSLKGNDLDEGIPKALYFAKKYFNVDNIVVYKMDEEGNYIHLLNDVLLETDPSVITVALNTAKKIVENRKFYNMSLNVDFLKHVLFISINLEKARYVVAMTDTTKPINLDENAMDLFIESLHIVFDKYEIINHLKIDANVDVLTGLSNRLAYENSIEDKNPSDGTIYALLDLFRLKTINDNYSHEVGDEYIKQTAEVLKKYFPEHIYLKDSHGITHKYATGSCVYRISGDEFILISEVESLESVQLKIAYAQEEVKNLSLNVSDPIGVNYGLVVKNGHETFKDLYIEADKLLSDDKREVYKALGLDRRK